MAEGSLAQSSKLRVRAVVLDLDGTLIDCREDFVIALNQMLDEFALPHINKAFVTLTIGNGSQNLVRETLKQVSKEVFDLKIQERALERYLHFYHQINGEYSKVYEGVAESLDRLLSAGYLLACLTNKPSALAGPVLVKKGLAHFFRCVFGGDAFIRQKPDPLPLIKTCETLKVIPQETLMVGDSIHDAQTARHANSYVALVRYGFNHGIPIDEVDADLYLNSLMELPELIEKIEITI